VAFVVCSDTLSPRSVAAAASPALQGLPTYTASQIDGPVVMGDPTKTELDSLRLVYAGMTQFCATKGAPTYMRTACARMSRSVTRLTSIVGARFQVRAETSFVHDTVLVPGPVPPPNVGCPMTSCPSYLATYYYNTDATGEAQYLPVSGDTITVCAVLTGPAPSTTRKLVWPPVRVRQIGLDSASFVERGGNPLSSMCARALAGSGLTSTDSTVVTWGGDWLPLTGRRLWRPLLSVP
jgi:hypothetical protein